MNEPIQDVAPPAHPSNGDAGGLSFAGDLSRLASEAKAFAQAELAFQKSRAAYAAAETKTIVILAVVALVLVFFAVMAFVVGTVIALGPVLGPWGAMAAVTLGLLLLVVLALLNARSRVKRMMAIVSNREST